MHETTALRQLTMSVLNCARCKKDHHLNLVFIAFEYPFIENDGTVWEYWASCPNVLAPILARVVENEEDRKAFHFLEEKAHNL